MRIDSEPNDDIAFDRLIDGELSDAERRQLLVSLDDRPGGWRKCALAFLEAQTWQRELGQFVHESTDIQNATRPAEDSPIASQRVVQFLTLAASVFVAFTLGLAFGDLPHPHQRATPSPFKSQLASTPARQMVPMPQARMRNIPANDQPANGNALTLWARDESGHVRPMRVPLVDASTLDRQWGTQFQSGLSPEVRQQLEQRGYKIESKRHYAPLVVDNGRPLIVPVEDTKIVPVSNRVY